VCLYVYHWTIVCLHVFIVQCCDGELPNLEVTCVPHYVPDSASVCLTVSYFLSLSLCGGAVAVFKYRYTGPVHFYWLF